MRAFHTRKAPEQTFRSYTAMVITHCSSTASSKDSLKFGLQSSSIVRLPYGEKCANEFRPSQSQFGLYRFYPNQDVFSVWNQISEFQRSELVFTLKDSGRKLFFGIASYWNQPKKCALYLSRERTEFYGAFDNRKLKEKLRKTKRVNLKHSERLKANYEHS